MAPERRVRATTGAARVSYGLTAQALQDVRPVEATLKATPIQTHARAVAQGGEDARGEEPGAGVEGGPADGETLPLPDGPLTVGIDGGYVRDWEEKSATSRSSWARASWPFAETARRRSPSGKCFGFVQTLETKPKRRLFEGLNSPGQPDEPTAHCLSDWRRHGARAPAAT